jgi:glycine hydroxymethyltransferase
MAEDTTAISLEEVKKLAWEGDALQAAELVARLGEDHVAWHEHSLNLVASHNVMSPKAKAIMHTDLIESTSAGVISARSHTGGVFLDRIETLLVELAKKLFGVPYVEYLAPSGAMSNGLFVFGAMEPGDRIMALSSRYGGHYTYLESGYPGVMGLEITEMPCYGEDYPVVNLELLAQEVERVRPKWMIIGSATLLFPYPLAEMAEIAQGVGAQIWYDGAHILGLAAGGQFQDPLHEGASVMTGSTQKTLPGPLGGLVLMHDPEVAERVTGKATSFIASNGNARTAALVVTLAEMLAFGKEYASAVVRNAQALARALDAEGFTVAGKDRGFTQSHVVLVDLGSTPRGKQALERLEEAHISCSPADLPRTYPHKTVLRLGSSACTRKGMGEGEMAEVARLMRRVVLDGEDPSRVGRDVADLASGFTSVHYCF